MTELETSKNKLESVDQVGALPGIVRVRRENIYSGRRVVIEFLNGYGASAIQNFKGCTGIYGNESGNTWELAALDGFDGELIDTPITGGSGGVAPWLSLSELTDKLTALASLPPRSAELSGPETLELEG